MFDAKYRLNESEDRNFLMMKSKIEAAAAQKIDSLIAAVVIEQSSRRG